MQIKNYDNVDEQIQELEALCKIAFKKFKFYDDEYEAELEEGFVPHQDLIDLVESSKKAYEKAVHNWHSLQRYCAINKVDLTKHWIRLGFTPKQIQEMAEELKNS